MKLCTALLSLVLVALPLSAEAEENRPRGMYVPYGPPPGMVLPDTAPDTVVESHRSNIIFLNRCKGNCSITAGYPDDSRINKSSIPRSGTRTLSEFAYGDNTWNAIVACVREMYEPFNIEITDQDPGSSVEHFEAMVAGSPGEVGMPNGVGGVSPFSCGIINNYITYSFANIYGGSVQQICEVVAQETAHAFGLEHEAYCPDPMTYDYGCGAKRFRDYDAPCGEYEDQPRSCDCGGATQNSVAEMMGHFGPSVPTPPTVAITAPADGSQVEPGFVVRIEAEDNVSVERAELWVNGVMSLSLSTKPFVFNAPETTSQGTVAVEVRVYDNRGDMGSDSIQVILGEPCGGSSDCESGEVCIEGRCVDGPDADGGLGQTCESGADCTSNVCGEDGAGNKYCTETCTMSCPGGFQCLSAGDNNVCWPGGDEGGGCSAGGGQGSLASFLLALMFGGFILRRRRVR
jgi:hypothetical protein